MSREKLFRSRWLIIAMHVLLWGLFLLLPFLSDRPPGKMQEPPPLPMIVSRALWILLFYFNAYFLVPHFLSRRQFLLYALLAGILLLPDLFFETVARPRGPHPPVFMLIFPGLFMLAISTTFRLVSDQLQQEEKQKERETVSLRSELTFLRSQMNPHFMFNVMNSLVALARRKSNQLEPALVRLSGLLHYMLYEAEEKIGLTGEIDYLMDYIDLQLLRFGDQIRVEVRFDCDEQAAGLHLEPMLLIPFVENAFKHGTGVLSEPLIHVQLYQRGKELRFTVENNFSSSPAEKPGGIGLSNVRRRLDLLYPDKHMLKIDRQENLHRIQLTLSLT